MKDRAWTRRTALAAGAAAIMGAQAHAQERPPEEQAYAVAYVSAAGSMLHTDGTELRSLGANAAVLVMGAASAVLAPTLFQ